MLKTVMDYQLVRSEIYNPNDFTITFILMPEMITWIAQNGILVGAARVVCKPNDFCILNHSYYEARASNGAELINVIRNYGDNIGKGNKLPSAPLKEKKYL